MSMTIPSPLMVARNRNERLVREAAPVVRYSTTTGDAPKPPTSGQIHRAKQALAEIRVMQDQTPKEMGCCAECDMGSEWADKVRALWAIVERVPAQYR